MSILSNDNNLSDNVELLFPSDDELEAMVPFDEKDISSQKLDVQENILLEPEKENKSLNVSETVPSTSKKVKRRGRGLGKKTIVRNTIMDMLKGFDLEELNEIQEFVQDLYQKKKLNDSINEMYSGFLNMSDEQIRDFENSIKYFKKDEVSKHK